MKKSLAILLIVFIATLAYSQKYIDKIADLTCECMEENETLLRMNPDEEAGKCVLEAMSKYSKKIEKELGGLEGDDADLAMEKLMEKVGMKLGLNCPIFREIILNYQPPKYDYYTEGIEHFKNEEFELALDDFGYMEYPERGLDYYIIVGLCYYHLGNYSDAEKNYEMALQFDPESPELYDNLSQALKHQYKYREAISAIDSAISYAPDSAKYYFRRGEYLFSSYKYEEACRYIKIAIEKDPEQIRYYEKLAYAKSRQLEYDTAIIVIQKVIELAPEEPGPYYSLGYYLFKSESYSDAVDNFIHYNSQVPAEEQEFKYISMSYYNLTDYEQSKNNFQQCNDSVDDINVDYRLALCDFQMANYESVIDFTTKTIEKDSINGHYKMRARAYIKMKNFEKALDDLNKIQQDDPCGCEAYQLQSTCFKNLGRSEDYSRAMIVWETLGCEETDYGSELIMKY